jgi:hypothetical protein
MRNISFMFTQPQIRARTKTVTRRLGWATLKAGDLLRGVEKGRGLKAGEKVGTLAVIRVVDVRPEPLFLMTADLDYGRIECEKEGFAGHSTLSRPGAFVEYFCASHRGCTPDTVVTRIEFEYVN